ncbi:MAG: nucleoside triphosphate pyrophosphohydrolase family protein [Lachnospiraceae bacterium]|nr:nucleoside triphosphate pyrophosphohydrolase family protein [Lachnospiraceae bacterium]
MTAEEYQKLASRTLSKDLNDVEMLIEGAMGICSEAGEAMDIVKKYFAHGHELDKEHLIKELGDVCWYMAELLNLLGYTFSDVFEANIQKLEKRYPNGFESAKSINREAGDI